MRRQSDTSSSRKVLKFKKTHARTRVSRRGRESYFIQKCQEKKSLLGKNKSSAIGLHNRRHKTHYTRRKFCWRLLKINKGFCAYKNSSTLRNNNAAPQESAAHKFGITPIFTFSITYNIRDRRVKYVVHIFIKRISSNVASSIDSKY